jgi:hypothetical protein
MQELTNLAVGKGIEYGLSATIGSVLTISDFMDRLAGFAFHAATKEIQTAGGVPTRYNPHTLWTSAGIFSDEYVFKESALQNYVKFILYCYPKDLDAGYRGFRYGAENDKGECGKLKSIKNKA